jgi:alpha-glucuronidase
LTGDVFFVILRKFRTITEQAHGSYAAYTKAIAIEPRTPSFYFGRGNVEQARLQDTAW